MPHTDTAGRTDRTGDLRRDSHKSTLACPHCGREGPVDGDWLRVATDAGVDIHCPACLGHLTTRRAKRRSVRGKYADV